MSWFVQRLVLSEHVQLSPVDAPRLAFREALHTHVALDALEEMHTIRREEHADGG